MKKYSHIIVGTGQASGTLLAGLLEKKESVAVIEEGRVGGTCVNTGCTPTKTLAASARVAHVVRRAGEYGVEAGEPKINFAKVMDRMNKIRNGNSGGFEKWLRDDERIDFFKDHALFTGSKTLKAGGQELEGENIYINVGARARTAPIPGIDSVGWLDNDRLLDLKELPEHLVVIGGSYIALEFGQMFHRFGSKVTILERSDRIMSREDDDIAGEALRILSAEGLNILTSASVKEVSQPRKGEIEVTMEQKGETFTVSGSHLLAATGRVPNSDGLDLDKAGIEVNDRGYIVVDDYCRTNIDGVFAVGDVNGRGAFTHTSVNDGEIVLDYLAGGGRGRGGKDGRKLSDRIPIYAMFIDPALGRVGLSEEQALEKGYKILKATKKVDQISRAIEMGETEGLVKFIVDAKTDRFLGAAIFAPRGDEVVAMIASFMYSGEPCGTYRRSVLIHPTISEMMPWILDELKPVN